MASVVDKLVSSFPQIPPLDPSKKYQLVIDQARGEYNRIYDVYSRASAEIEPLTKHWEKRYQSIEVLPTTQEKLKEELSKNIDQYIKYRQMREDTYRILKIFDEAIVECTPPLLDVETLVVLGKLNAKISDIQQAYDKIFTVDLSQIKEQRERIQQLYNRIINSLPALRQSLEPLAIHCNTGWKILAIFGQTPYVNTLVAAREKEIQALVKIAE